MNLIVVQFARMKLLTITAANWDEREVTLRRKNFETFKSTIPGQTL